MAPALCNQAIVANNPVHKSILFVDSTTPETGEISFERLRLPGPHIGIPQDFFDQAVNKPLGGIPLPQLYLYSKSE